MAIQRLTIKGYGQVELNQAAFRRDGRIEAQCKLKAGESYIENGMLLVVDPVKHEVSRSTGAAGEKILLHYSAEHMYREEEKALRDFYLDGTTVCPRMGYLSLGDKFTSNCICYDTAEFADDATLKTAIAACATTAIYGVACTNGAIKLTKTKPTAAVPVLLQVVKGYSMPDKQYGVQFVSIQ